MGKDADDIKTDMSKTKSKIAKTVDDLTSTASDAAAASKDRVTTAVSGVSASVSDAASTASDRVQSVAHDALDKIPPDAKGAARSPLILVGVVAAVAFAIGYFVPITSFERARLQPLGDDLARRGEQARDEVLSAGKAVVSETVAAAKASLKTHSDEAAQNLGFAPESPDTEV